MGPGNIPETTNQSSLSPCTSYDKRPYWVCLMRWVWNKMISATIIIILSRSLFQPQRMYLTPSVNLLMHTAGSQFWSLALCIFLCVNDEFRACVMYKCMNLG